MHITLQPDITIIHCQVALTALASDLAGNPRLDWSSRTKAGAIVMGYGAALLPSDPMAKPLMRAIPEDKDEQHKILTSAAEAMTMHGTGDKSIDWVQLLQVVASLIGIFIK